MAALARPGGTLKYEFLFPGFPGSTGVQMLMHSSVYAYWGWYWLLRFTGISH